MEYGLYLTNAQYPLFTGTRIQCIGQVKELTDEQLERGWSVVPVPEEPAALPLVDPGATKQIWIISAVSIGLILILVLTMLARGGSR